MTSSLETGTKVTGGSRVTGQSGQLVVEAVLIIVALMFVTFMVASYFKDKEFVKKLISGPWVSLAGLIEDGVWLPLGQSATSHPNGHGRHVTIDGEHLR